MRLSCCGAGFAACPSRVGSRDHRSSSSRDSACADGLARAMRRLLARRRFELVHLNEPHALTAAWLAGARAHLPLLLSRRIGFPLQKNAVSQARFRAVERFVANSEDVAQSLIDSGIAAERISIVNEGVEILPLRTPEQRSSSARKRWNMRESEFLFGCVSVFVPEKGQRHLIEALPLVRELHPEVRLLLAGGRPMPRRTGGTFEASRPDRSGAFSRLRKGSCASVRGARCVRISSEFEGLGTRCRRRWPRGCLAFRRCAERSVKWWMIANRVGRRAQCQGICRRDAAADQR